MIVVQGLPTYSGCARYRQCARYVEAPLYPRLLSGSLSLSLSPSFVLLFCCFFSVRPPVIPESGWTGVALVEEAAPGAAFGFVRFFLFFLCVFSCCHQFAPVSCHSVDCHALVSCHFVDGHAPDKSSRFFPQLHSVFCVASAALGHAFPLGRCPEIPSGSALVISSFMPHRGLFALVLCLIRGLFALVSCLARGLLALVSCLRGGLPLLKFHASQEDCLFQLRSSFDAPVFSR